MLKSALSFLVMTVVIYGQSATGYSDTAPAPSTRFPSKWYPNAEPYVSTQAPVKGIPYSATMVTTTTLPVMAGQAPHSVSESMPWYRDGAGRTRTEQGGGGTYRTPDGKEHNNAHHEIEVIDPVSHCQFRWSEPWTGQGQPVATVSCLPRSIHYSTADRYAWIEAQTASNEHSDRIEPLGHKMFNGFDALGAQNIRQQGNQQTVIEFWYSPQLHELLWFGPNPPQFGINTFEMKDIHLGEPNPELFYPPANYRILGPGETAP